MVQPPSFQKSGEQARATAPDSVVAGPRQLVGDAGGPERRKRNNKSTHGYANDSISRQVPATRIPLGFSSNLGEPWMVRQITETKGNATTAKPRTRKFPNIS